MAERETITIDIDVPAVEVETMVTRVVCGTSVLLVIHPDHRPSSTSRRWTVEKPRALYSGAEESEHKTYKAALAAAEKAVTASERRQLILTAARDAADGRTADAPEMLVDEPDDDPVTDE